MIKREPFSYTYKGPMAFLVMKADEASVRGGRYLPILQKLLLCKTHFSLTLTTMEGTQDWFLRALLTGKASFGMWCDVTADWALGLGFIWVVAIPQFICFPQGITALLRGLEKI